MLKEGRYPPQPTGYITDPQSPKAIGINPNATFVKPVEIIAEATARLSRCGVDGNLVCRHWINGESFEDLALSCTLFWGRQCDIWEIIQRTNRAIIYCRGYKRRAEGYQRI